MAVHHCLPFFPHPPYLPLCEGGEPVHRCIGGQLPGRMLRRSCRLARGVAPHRCPPPQGTSRGWHDCLRADAPPQQHSPRSPSPLLKSMCRSTHRAKHTQGSSYSFGFGRLVLLAGMVHVGFVAVYLSNEEGSFVEANGPSSPPLSSSTRSSHRSFVCVCTVTSNVVATLPAAPLVSLLATLA